MKHALWQGIVVVLLAATSSLVTWFVLQHLSQTKTTFLSPLLTPDTAKVKPLQAYSISNLATRDYHASHITLEKILFQNQEYASYLFSFVTLNKKMSGQVNIPSSRLPGNPTILMLRGYVESQVYSTGVGTKNAAAVLAQNGFITVAPDFFGYGESDDESQDTWQARFEKPIVVIELIKTLQAAPLQFDPKTIQPSLQLPTTNHPMAQSISLGKIGLWGHSNGGQIALSTLEVIGQSLPTTLWAPVTAPFPYSLLYFSDENVDEGKEMRRWISIFEKDYDVFDFSLTRHLDRLSGPLQLHHGTADDSALMAWSDEFEAKIKAENKRRQMQSSAEATPGASRNQSALSPIEISYFTYPGANHNLQPGWNTVMERDLAFFRQHLSN